MQTNADYFGADIYKTKINDDACKLINEWVSEKTDSTIPKIIEQIPQNAIMYLVNALAFESTWERVYDSFSIKEGTFTTEDKTKQDAKFMTSQEFYYLEDENATGFIKHFTGKEYAFVALLPNEDISISDYLATLDAKSLASLLADPEVTLIDTSISKFETSYDAQMAQILADMGMPLAFYGENADFGRLGTSKRGNISVCEVSHKTFISVGQRGVRAGAASAVLVTDSLGYAQPSQKQVLLDRPFVYMIIDCQNNAPLFIGTLMDLGK